MKRGPAWDALVSRYYMSDDRLDTLAEGYAAGVADERARGMRRAARYAAHAFGWQAYTWLRFRQARVRASVRCDRIARGEPAFTTPRAFGGKP